MAANPVVPISQLDVETLKAQDSVTVICRGRITADNDKRLKDEIRALIPTTKHIVVDLKDVTHIDSSGLGALVSVYVSARKNGVELKLLHLNDRIKQLLRLTKLASVFEGYGEFL